jgi:hypothetical protein
VLSPKPSPSQIPAARAIMFLTLPESSTPRISVFVYILKESVEKFAWTFSARDKFSEAATIVVGISRETSSACDGPERTAIFSFVRLGTSSASTSVMSLRVPVSIPLATTIQPCILSISC